MATQCMVALDLGHRVDSVVVHSDGYPEYMIPMLTAYYNTYSKVKDLIDLGHLSVVEARVAPHYEEEHTFDDPLPDVTVAYARDKGEYLQIDRYPTVEDWIDDTGNYSYAYIFSENQWWQVDDDLLIPVS